MATPMTGQMLAGPLAGARPVPYWLDQPGAPGPQPPLTRATAAGLAVVGGGFTGLWTALLAKERDPDADVVLLEGRTAGWAASGRNGGFCAASLTHGLANGQARFPGEIADLDRLGMTNLTEIAATITRYRIGCAAELTGELAVAVAPWQLPGLHEDARAARALGHDVRVLTEDEVRAEVDSPTYLGGVWYRDACLMLDPARLAWGLRRACLEAGVRIFEHSPVTGVSAQGQAGLRGVPRQGSLLGGPGGLGARAHPPLPRRLRPLLGPGYGHGAVSRPLPAPPPGRRSSPCTRTRPARPGSPAAPRCWTRPDASAPRAAPSAGLNGERLPRICRTSRGTPTHATSACVGIPVPMGASRLRRRCLR